MYVYFYFTKPKGFQWFPLSLFIRWSEYYKSLIPFNFFGLYHSSHVAIGIKTEKSHYVYEAIFWLGVRKISYKDWLKKNKVNVSYQSKLTTSKHNVLTAYLEGSIGVPYSYMENIGILLQRIFKTLFRKKIPNIFKSNNKKRKCSEFALEGFLKIYDKERVALTHNGVDSISPHNFEDILLTKLYKIHKEKV